MFLTLREKAIEACISYISLEKKCSKNKNLAIFIGTKIPDFKPFSLSVVDFNTLPVPVPHIDQIEFNKCMYKE